MNNIRRIALLALTLVAMLVLVACGDEKKEDTPPTNTAVSIETPSTLIGNYEIVSFNQSNDIGVNLRTDNLSEIQSFKGQATIEIIDNKIVIKSKIQLESVTLDAMVDFAGDQTFQLTNYKDNYSLAPEAIYSADTQSISADNITIKQDGELIVVSVKIIQILPVDVTVKLKKVNDAVIALDSNRYWLNSDKLLNGTTIFPKALTSYYRITGTEAGADNIFTPVGNTFRGNMSIVFQMGGVENGLGKVTIYYKFQDPSNTNADWQGYRYGTATYDIIRYIDMAKLDAEIVKIFQGLGAEVIDETHMNLTFKSPADNNSILAPGNKDNTTQVYETLVLDPALPIPTGKKIVFKLEKLYDGTLLGMPTAEQHPIVQTGEYYK